MCWCARSCQSVKLSQALALLCGELHPSRDGGGTCFLKLCSCMWAKESFPGDSCRVCFPCKTGKQAWGKNCCHGEGAWNGWLWINLTVLMVGCMEAKSLFSNHKWATVKCWDAFVFQGPVWTTVEGLFSVCGPEIRQKDFLIKRYVWITTFRGERDSLTTGKVREVAVGIKLYKWCFCHHPGMLLGTLW